MNRGLAGLLVLGMSGFMTSSARREVGGEQSDVLSALDVAVPVEVYRMNGPLAGHRFGLYVAPRAVFQTFEDQRPEARPAETKGTMFGGLVGLSARWRYVALSGEFNVMKTPVMRFEDASFGGGTHLLPSAAVRLIWPLGG